MPNQPSAAILAMPADLVAVGASAFGISFYTKSEEAAQELKTLLSTDQTSPFFEDSKFEVDGKACTVSSKEPCFNVLEKSEQYVEMFSNETGVKIVSWLDSVNYN